ncbi:hypothetical protein BH09ACT10_BH09ACT10_24370 [soil metagenome]
MSDVFLALIALGTGAFLCFRGYWAMRVVISVWGALVGFGLGSGLVSLISDDSYLVTGLGWIVGFVVALIFSVLAYLYYAIGVVLSLGSMGFVIGATVMVAFGVSWNWVIAIVGVVCGTLLAALAILIDLPSVVLAAIGAFAGSAIFVGGLMLLTGALDSADFSKESVTTTIDDNWWWYFIFVVFAIFGLFAQASDATARRSMREGWDSGTRY